MTTRITEPTLITQGESLAWTKTLADFPATTYHLQYRFRSQNGPGFDVTASADGEDHDVTVAATVTDGLAVGRFDWQAWVTEIADATNVRMIATGIMTVEQGFSTSTQAAVDTRSVARRVLDAIDAAMSGKATADQLEYEISTPTGTTRVKRMSMTELMAAQRHYAVKVAREEAKKRVRAGGPYAVSIPARFRND